MAVKQLENILSKVKDKDTKIFLETYSYNEATTVLLAENKEEGQKILYIADETDNLEYELKEEGTKILKTWTH